MIKAAITSNFPNQALVAQEHNTRVFLADYTKQTSSTRGVELFSPNPPHDNDYFSLDNPNGVEITTIIFDNSSFTHSNGQAKSQCEAVIYPQKSTSTSWILFLELKYVDNIRRNERRIKKALGQLFKTRYHYIQKNVISKTNTCYMIASLPNQGEPFPNFILTPAYLAKLKLTRNIVLRLTNKALVQDEFVLVV